jgi:hypothetical protein
MKTGVVAKMSVCAVIVFAAPGLVVGAGAPRASSPPGGRVDRLALDRDLGDLDVALEPGLGRAAGGPSLGEPPGLAAGSALERARALKAERAAAAAGGAAAVAASARTVAVDCTRGRSIQRAIDHNDPPLIVEIHGVCQENVRIERKQVTLRGADPTTDGIQGVAADPPAPAALAIFYADGVAIENLSISDGPGVGVGMWFSHVTMVNVRVEGNASAGLNASSASFLDALEVTVSDNGAQGLNAQRGAIVFCTGCVFADNAGFAATARLAGILTLLDGTVSGGRGLSSTFNSYADIDCVSSTATSYPCSLDVTAIAAVAGSDATAALFGAGDFSGQLLAVERGDLYLFGARQLATGTTPGGAPRVNGLGQFSTLFAEPFVDEDEVAHESRLKGQTNVTGFSRALLTGETVVDGTLTCSSAGDAWADPGVTVTAGGGIADCEHAALP